MTVTELTKEIYDKYPKVWGKIKDKYHNQTINNEKHCQTSITVFDNKYNKDYKVIELNDVDSIPFSMLYGLLEDFFEENGIIISIGWSLTNAEPFVYYYHIYREIKSDYYRTKDEAKQQAILKACEILEGKL